MRKCITQPEDWWKAFQRAAKQQGKCLSSWLGEAAKAALPEADSCKLSDRAPAHRPAAKDK